MLRGAAPPPRRWRNASKQTTAQATPTFNDSADRIALDKLAALFPEGDEAFVLALKRDAAMRFRPTAETLLPARPKRSGRSNSASENSVSETRGVRPRSGKQPA